MEDCTLGKASPATKKIKIYKTFFDVVDSMPQPDRRACYAGLITHEFSHSCDKLFDGPNSAAETREDAAFDYWKGRFAVSADLDPNGDCTFD